MRRLRRWPIRAGLAAGLLVTSCLVAISTDTAAYGDATAPPPLPTATCPMGSGPSTSCCPNFQFPPPDYPVTAKPIPYEVPFKGIIAGGDISLPPLVDIPHLFASVCGLVQLPQLTGTIYPQNVYIATPNIYVAHLEAIPIDVTFGTLHANIDLQPAHNGGLDITLTGSTNAAVKTLGMVCGITLKAKFTTLQDGALQGQPVTGPTMSGQAEAVSNSFEVPAVVGSNSSACPPAIAQTFNKLLSLPARVGLGKFVTPFCFDFELEGINTPKATKACPWR